LEKKAFTNFIVMSSDKNRMGLNSRQDVKINLIKSKSIAKLNRLLFV